jgi:hypothetical protein
MFRALQSGARQTAVGANRPRLRTLPPPHSYGNQRLQRQFDGLLMMDIVIPETCWAVSVQGNKFYDWLLHLVGCFHLNGGIMFILSFVSLQPFIYLWSCVRIHCTGQHLSDWAVLTHRNTQEHRAVLTHRNTQAHWCHRLSTAIQSSCWWAATFKIFG